MHCHGIADLQFIKSNILITYTCHPNTDQVQFLAKVIFKLTIIKFLDFN